MENRLQATFMPRQSAVTGEAYVRPKGPPNFLMLIGSIVFILTLATVGGLFAYRSFVQVGNAEKKTQVEEAIKNFEPELTKELTTLKARVDAGKFLISNHNAVSVLFSLIGQNTAQTVRFEDLTVTISEDKKISLSLKGEARSYNAIAFQSDVFSKVEYLKNPIFTSLNLDEKGVISFNVTAELDPTAISYKKLFPGSADESPNDDAGLGIPGTVPPPLPATSGSATSTSGGSSGSATSTASSTNQTGS